MPIALLLIELLVFMATIPDSIEHSLLRNISTLYKVSFQMHFLAVTLMQTSAYFYTLIRDGNFKLLFSKTCYKTTGSATAQTAEVAHQLILTSYGHTFWKAHF